MSSLFDIDPIFFQTNANNFFQNFFLPSSHQGLRALKSNERQKTEFCN